MNLPSNLQSLTLGRRFNQSLEGVNLPSNLQSLTLGRDFNQSLEGVNLPSSLQSLTLGRDFNQSLEGVNLPSSLQSLFVVHGGNFLKVLKGVCLPSSLRTLKIGCALVSCLWFYWVGIVWAGLKILPGSSVCGIIWSEDRQNRAYFCLLRWSVRFLSSICEKLISIAWFVLFRCRPWKRRRRQFSAEFFAIWSPNPAKSLSNNEKNNLIYQPTGVGCQKALLKTS